MELYSIEGNSQRLDGGAMFGNAPKSVWSKWIEVDGGNTVKLASRGLLVKFDDGLIVLFEAGVGAFFSPEMRSRYGVLEPEHILLNGLSQLGLVDSDIDAVVLSHLHFDHAGGLLSAWEEGIESYLLFPNAKFLVSQKQWLRAQSPHQRDRASYIPLLTKLLMESGRLEIIAPEQKSCLEGKVKIYFSDGHTPGLMISEIEGDQGPIVFTSDLIPAAPWVHIPISMGYDRFPELLIDEKKALLDDLYKRNGQLFFTHDLNLNFASLKKDKEGRFFVLPA